MKIKLIIILSLTLNISFAKIYDGIKLNEKKIINNVTLHSTLIEDTRIFHATSTKLVQRSISELIPIVIAFENRCNNDYSKKKTLLINHPRCKYFNQNLVESFPIKKIKKNYKKLPNEINRFLLHRHVYNRKETYYYDLIIVRKTKNKENQDQVIVSYQMLTDKQVREYMDNPVEKESYFQSAEGAYILTKIGKNQTSIELTYASKTDHWVLNSDLAVSTIYGKIAEGTSSALKTFEKGYIYPTN